MTTTNTTTLNTLTDSQKALVIKLVEEGKKVEFINGVVHCTVKPSAGKKNYLEFFTNVLRRCVGKSIKGSSSMTIEDLEVTSKFEISKTDIGYSSTAKVVKDDKPTSYFNIECNINMNDLESFKAYMLELEAKVVALKDQYL